MPSRKVSDASPGVEWWKYTTTALAGVLMTVGSLWASGTFESVTREEAINITKAHGPYVKDRQALMQSVKSNTDSISKLVDENKLLRSQLAELIGELRATRR